MYITTKSIDGYVFTSGIANGAETIFTTLHSQLKAQTIVRKLRNEGYAAEFTRDELTLVCTIVGSRALPA